MYLEYKYCWINELSDKIVVKAQLYQGNYGGLDGKNFLRTKFMEVTRELPLETNVKLYFHTFLLEECAKTHDTPINKE